MLHRSLWTKHEIPGLPFVLFWRSCSRDVMFLSFGIPSVYECATHPYVVCLVYNTCMGLASRPPFPVCLVGAVCPCSFPSVVEGRVSMIAIRAPVKRKYGMEVTDRVPMFPIIFDTHVGTASSPVVACLVSFSFGYLYLWYVEAISCVFLGHFNISPFIFILSLRTHLGAKLGHFLLALRLLCFNTAVQYSSFDSEYLMHSPRKCGRPGVSYHFLRFPLLLLSLPFCFVIVLRLSSLRIPHVHGLLACVCRLW